MHVPVCRTLLITPLLLVLLPFQQRMHHHSRYLSLAYPMPAAHLFMKELHACSLLCLVPFVRSSELHRTSCTDDKYVQSWCGSRDLPLSQRPS